MPSEDCINVLCSRVYNKCFTAVRETGPNLRVSKCRQKMLIEKQTEVHHEKIFLHPLWRSSFWPVCSRPTRTRRAAAHSESSPTFPSHSTWVRRALPAGKYTVTVLNPTSDRRILQIRSTNGRSSAMILTSGVIGDVSENSKLVFERDGDHYYFAQAQMAGDSTSLAAPRAKTNASAKPRMDTIAKKKNLVVDNPPDNSLQKLGNSLQAVPRIYTD